MPAPMTMVPASSDDSPPESLTRRLLAAFHRDRMRRRRGRGHARGVWADVLLVTWMTLALVVLVWHGVTLAQLYSLQTEASLRDQQTLAWIWAETKVLQEEQLRLARNTCLSTVTIYDAARGVCDQGTGVVVEKKPLPRLKSDKR